MSTTSPKTTKATPYKYDGLEKKLRELLDSDELELTHARRINKKWLARELDVRNTIFSKTPKLGVLITKKQAELDQHFVANPIVVRSPGCEHGDATRRIAARVRVVLPIEALVDHPTFECLLKGLPGLGFRTRVDRR